MPHEDSGFPFASSNSRDTIGDDIDGSLPDIAPRERSRTTATPLNPNDQRLASLADLADGEIPADWSDTAAAGGWDDGYDEADGDLDSDGAAGDAGVPFAAPVTARIEALRDLAPLKPAPQAAPATARIEAIQPPALRASYPPALRALDADVVTPPTVIPGAKRLKRPPKHPFIARRRLPMTVGLFAFTVIAALVAAGMVVAAPLGNALEANGNPLQPFASAASAKNGVRFTWYTARWGDTPESLAQDFHVALGGIYELNNLQAGDELLIGRQYMIPQNPTYGETYQPPAMLNVTAHYGNIRYGPNWWNSIAGGNAQNGVCAPDGGANELGYDLQAPNWGSRWVRGYIVYGTWVYHTGVDLAADQGNVIHAAQAGQVIWAGYDATNGLGWSVKIDHCNHVSTVYGHMLRTLVHVGDYVDVGAPVGLEGSTGNSTGPHLHFMVEWNNLWVNPMLFYATRALIINPAAA